jgi:hypothetical protein
MNKNSLFAVVFAGMMLASVSNVSADTEANNGLQSETWIEKITNSRVVTHIRAHKWIYGGLGLAAIVGYFVVKNVVANQEEAEGDMTKVRYSSNK